MNPVAIVFWAVCAGVGYLLSGPHGALVWLICALSISLLASFLPSRRR